MSEIADLTYYQKDRDVIINKAKFFYKNNKERLKVKWCVIFVYTLSNPYNHVILDRLTEINA